MNVRIHSTHHEEPNFGTFGSVTLGLVAGLMISRKFQRHGAEHPGRTWKKQTDKIVYFGRIPAICEVYV